jgi:hypothetical protein
VPGLRREDIEGPAAAEQSAVQQAIRGCRGSGVRRGVGAAGGAAYGYAGEHGARHRPALSGSDGLRTGASRRYSRWA